jgi:hypothetical protein
LLHRQATRKGTALTAEDILTDAATRGINAGRSRGFQNDVMMGLRAFGKSLAANMAQDDVAGVMVTAGVIRGGKMLGSGVVLTLQDRVLVGWMQGMLKKPFIATIPLSSISSVERKVKPAGGRMARATPALAVQAADAWELLCSSEVPQDAPLYGMLAGLLGGSLDPKDLPPVE